LQSEREVLIAESRIAPATEMVRTGRLFADEWAPLQDLDDRRRLLASVLDHLDVLPGKGGPRGINPDRLVVHWSIQPGLVRVVDGQLRTVAAVDDLDETA
jgi:hypothetical protein